jgi:hypothetical protein
MEPAWSRPIVKERSQGPDQGVSEKLFVSGSLNTKGGAFMEFGDPLNDEGLVLKDNPANPYLWVFSSNPESSELEILTKLVGGPQNIGFACFSDTYVNDFTAANVLTDNQTIPNALSITTQPGPNNLYDPKTDIQEVDQGETYILDISRIIFLYDFDPNIPNVISFNLDNVTLANKMFFVKNSDGNVDLPVTLTLVNNVLSIANIPVDANGECSAMLLII